MQHQQNGIFLNFRPGLVGGHCIGMILINLENEQIGYKPEMILSGRKVNEM